MTRLFQTLVKSENQLQYTDELLPHIHPYFCLISEASQGNRYIQSLKAILLQWVTLK